MWRVPLWLAIGIFATVAPAAAQTFRLINCSEVVLVRVYNGDDVACIVPKEDKALNTCADLPVNCSGGACKVAMGSSSGGLFACGSMPKYSGHKVYTRNGEIKDLSELREIHESNDPNTKWTDQCLCGTLNMPW
ncbi:MAG: hypothetical protein ACREJ0_05595, partial [Geminicoccaceae bacterium]